MREGDSHQREGHAWASYTLMFSPDTSEARPWRGGTRRKRREAKMRKEEEKQQKRDRDGKGKTENKDTGKMNY